MFWNLPTWFCSSLRYANTHLKGTCVALVICWLASTLLSRCSFSLLCFNKIVTSYNVTSMSFTSTSLDVCHFVHLSVKCSAFTGVANSVQVPGNSRASGYEASDQVWLCKEMRCDTPHWSGAMETCHPRDHTVEDLLSTNPAGSE